MSCAGVHVRFDLSPPPYVCVNRHPMPRCVRCFYKINLTHGTQQAFTEQEVLISPGFKVWVRKLNIYMGIYTDFEFGVNTTDQIRAQQPHPLYC